MKNFKKVLVLGIDGLDPDLLRKLTDSGQAPNFARLWSTGAGGALASATPSQSPVVWTSIATGANPGRHGVFDFIHRDPKRYLPFLSISHRGGGGLLKSTQYTKPRRNAAFWDVLSAEGVPTTVVRWPVTFPPDTVSGNMLGGLGVPDLLGGLGRYSFYTTDPASAADVDPRSLVGVELNEGRIDTVVRGPMVQGLAKRTPATVPMTINSIDGGIRIELAGQSASVAENGWSEWLRVKFPAGPFKTVSGIVKFRLLQREPALQLYMTPVELDPDSPALPLSEPSDYAAELAGAIGLYHTLGMPEDTKALNEHALSSEAFAEQCDAITDERIRMFHHELNRFKEGVFAFVFDTSDRVQHMFWREHSLDADFKVTRVGARIRDHYLRMDRLIGEILDSLDASTALLVISDHGFTGFDVGFDLNAWLVSEGLMTLTADPRKATGDQTALYKYVDWSRTRAYGCGFTGLYFNLKGREGKGIVDAREVPDLARNIAERLGAFKDPRTGSHPVHRISGRDDVYSGDEIADAPDLVLGFTPGYRSGWHTPIGGVAGEIFAPNEKHWGGDHIVDPSFVPGTILTNLPLDVTDATVLDVAPTVCTLLGMPPNEGVEGKTLTIG